jgi:hypothetical protein
MPPRSLGCSPGWVSREARAANGQVPGVVRPIGSSSRGRGRPSGASPRRPLRCQPPKAGSGTPHRSLGCSAGWVSRQGVVRPRGSGSRGWGRPSGAFPGRPVLTIIGRSRRLTAIVLSFVSEITHKLPVSFYASADGLRLCDLARRTKRYSGDIGPGRFEHLVGKSPDAAFVSPAKMARVCSAGRAMGAHCSSR